MQTLSCAYGVGWEHIIRTQKSSGGRPPSCAFRCCSRMSLKTSFGPLNCSQPLHGWRIPKINMMLLSSWFTCGNSGGRLGCKATGMLTLVEGNMSLKRFHSLFACRLKLETMSSLSRSYGNGQMKAMVNAWEAVWNTLCSMLGATTPRHGSSITTGCSPRQVFRCHR